MGIPKRWPQECDDTRTRIVGRGMWFTYSPRELLEDFRDQFNESHTDDSPNTEETNRADYIAACSAAAAFESRVQRIAIAIGSILRDASILAAMKEMGGTAIAAEAGRPDLRIRRVAAGGYRKTVLHRALDDLGNALEDLKDSVGRHVDERTPVMRYLDWLEAYGKESRLAQRDPTTERTAPVTRADARIAEAEGVTTRTVRTWRKDGETLLRGLALETPDFLVSEAALADIIKAPHRTSVSMFTRLREEVDFILAMRASGN